MSDGLDALERDGLQLVDPATPACTEALTWRHPDDDMPDADISVLLWVRDGLSGQDWCSGWWDGEDWRDCASGGAVDGDVLRWAQVSGPVL